MTNLDLFHIVPDFVKPICLPTLNEFKLNSLDGYNMEVAGWGKTESRKFFTISFTYYD